jgi:hypothetical protein
MDSGFDKFDKCNKEDTAVLVSGLESGLFHYTYSILPGEVETDEPVRRRTTRVSSI